MYFIPRALSFGESAAVYGFNRASRFLSTVLSRCGDLVVSSYDDDFTQLEPEELGETATATLRETFARLGFALSVDP